MNFTKALYRLFIFGSFLFCFIFLFSCYKEEKTIAVITVLDNNTNEAIEGANVRLYYDGSNGSSAPLIDVRKTTSSNGSATFDFSDKYQDGQAGFAVLDVEVDTAYMGIINIVEMSTTEKVIFIP